ncbi:MAG TPA: proton-conducting transporter membrane subunit [Candidatus Polarisedimenticolaceae bacterium]|nr:proton-conducting transporter membrane subunit [Candidatus Polarisedimenticolaceae bacterium]
MQVLLLGIGLLALGGVAAGLLGGSGARAAGVGVGATLAGCALGLIPTVRVLATGTVGALELPWSVPGGAFHVALDRLSALFLLPVFLLPPLAAIYGAGYLRGRPARRVAASWLCFDLLVASMAMVLVARNAVLFLTAWEMMALSSFFLVTFEHEREAVRSAGWTYLIATHLGTALLLAWFALWGASTGSLDFDAFHRPPGWGAAGAGGAALLALVGFGTKAGLMPFHIWLPEAHPAAPSHVSAVMSGVMVNLGVYGLLLARVWLGPPEAAWGPVLLVVGGASALGGLLLALGQTDLKRVLAYSTVENVGVVVTGLGLGLVGERLDHPAVTLLGYGGALVHLLNHTAFKGVLFLGAGAVLHATGTVEMSRLGGLWRAMPRTGLAFFVGSAAAAALPPLNGFAGEFLILLGAYRALDSASALAVLAVLGLVTGLAAATFTRAFGIVFLGVARNTAGGTAHEPDRAMTWPMLGLAAGCLALGLAWPGLFVAAAQALAALGLAGAEPTAAAPGLFRLQLVAFLFLGLSVLVALGRRLTLARRRVASAPTWGCGFARPTSRMQYTASSFAEPLTSWFAALAPTGRRVQAPLGYFPPAASLDLVTEDPLRTRFYAPLFARLERLAARLRWLQHGRVQLYVLYIALTLVALLVWGMGWLR